jgi:hypothetical protein
MFGAKTEDDYGVNLDTALANANVGIGSDAITQGADNSGNTVWNDGYSLNNSIYDDYGKTVANSTNYSTTADNFNNAGSNLTTGLAGLNKFVNDNKALIGLAGAGSALLSGSGAQKTGYQGSIPDLMAGRTMITKPPTRAQGYRPGAGGIDYGGDVSYVRTPGVDPWSRLSGSSGSISGADLSSLPADVAAAINNSITGGTSGGFGTTSAAAAAAAAKAAADLAAAKKAGDAAAIAAAKLASDKAAADKLAADKLAADKAAADKLAVDNWRKSLSPTQYLDAINSWIASNPNMTKAELDAAMTKFKVTQTDLQTALGANKKLSAADIYALTHGQGLKEANAQQTTNIVKWIQDNPYATAQQIKDAVKGSGVNVTDINEALAGTKTSGAVQKALTEGTGLDQLYKDILNYQASGATPAQIAAAKTQYKVSDADMAAATKYAQDAKYTAVDARQVEAANKAAAAEQKRLNDAAYATQQAANEREWAAQQAKNERDWATQQADQRAAQEAAERVAAENVQIPSNNQGTAVDNKSDIYNYFVDPATQAALAAGDTRSIAETMQALGWSPAEVAAATGANAAEVQAAYDAALNQDTGYMQYAEGGEIAMAKGRYLQGGTDGMADELPARIGKDQPAALSHGEFVIPADVVSHMGNGNSDAGAKKLYQMMDKIRMARTGNKKQGKKINPDKFMPGGLASAYAKGGSVKHFLTGGPTAPAGTMGVESNLSNWAGPYVTNMLGQGQALANMPYQAYMGPLTAGQSSLQNQGFNAASSMTMPSSLTSAAQTAGSVASVAEGLPAYDATTFDNQYKAPTAYSPTTSSFDTAQATAYMNPYLEASLKPQLAEARRQSEITGQQNAAKMTQAGAFGGSRQAILDAENQRNLGTNLAGITGQGYNTAYGNAMSQFNADQARKMQEAQFGAQQGMAGAQLGAQYGLAGQQATEQSKQYGAGYGLQGLQTGLQAAQTQGALGTQINQAGLNNLNAQLSAGAQQRGIESEGIAADKAQFEEARANPYKMVQYQQSLLQGLPLAAQSYQGIEPTALVKAAQGATTVNGLLKALGLIE